MRTTRQHGIVVGALYYIGFFLLFCSLGTFGSAGFITYKATKWPVINAQLQDCSLGQHPLHKEPQFYNLNCGITYQLDSHSYKSILLTRFSRSIQERDAINDWIASHRGESVVIRVNPSFPHEFVVQSSLPGRRARDAGDFANAGIVLGSVSLVLLASAHTLVRRGW